MSLASTQRRTLSALLDRLIPADDFPGARASGVEDYVTAQWERGQPSRLPPLAPGLAALEAEAAALAPEPTSFADLDAGQQDALLRTLERGAALATWPDGLPAPPFLEAMSELAHEGYYADPVNGGNRNAVSWGMIGYDPRLPPRSARPAPPAARPSTEIHRDYDVIVVGAGLGGGIAAGVLAEAGHRILLLERGRALADEEIPADHLRNHRLPLYGDNTTDEPQAHPRVFVDSAGRERVVFPHEAGYHHNAFTVGGGARIWGAQAWRFHPDDFRMATRYGVPDGSSLANWPFGYDELAPYYDRAEREIGVAGEASDHAARSQPFPLPPVPRSPTGTWLAEGAARLGWKTFTPPLAINTRDYLGRGACVQCGQCIGFACPTDAKNGSHNTLLPRALATGLCTLLTSAHAEKIATDGRGRVTGVDYFLTHPDGRIERRSARARVVISAAGAIETARLLLSSHTPLHPHGLGNHSDQLGRHLQGHYYPIAYGLLPPDFPNPNLGPGVCIATTRFNHGNPGVIGGAMLANDFVKTPVIFWRTSLPPDIPRWGLANKRAMRDLYLRGVDVRGPVQEIPSPDSRVTLDPRIRDTFGRPVARLSGTTHPETIRTAEFIRQRAEEWLRATGAERVWSWPAELKLSAGQHQAGTCRMSDDPRAGVTDRWGRVHGHDNLFVTDGSLHVTNGGFNPALTIMALAFRTAEHIAQAVLR